MSANQARLPSSVNLVYNQRGSRPHPITLAQNIGPRIKPLQGLEGAGVEGADTQWYAGEDASQMQISTSVPSVPCHARDGWSECEQIAVRDLLSRRLHPMLGHLMDRTKKEFFLGISACVRRWSESPVRPCALKQQPSQRRQSPPLHGAARRVHHEGQGVTAVLSRSSSRRAWVLGGFETDVLAGAGLMPSDCKGLLGRIPGLVFTTVFS